MRKLAKISKEELRIVLSRLDRLPRSMKVTVAGGKKLDPDMMIEEVKSGSRLGVSLASVFLEDIRSFKDV